MSNLGVYTSRFEMNIKTLKEFDHALTIIRKGPESEKKSARSSLIKIMEPISEKVSGRLSTSIILNEGEITTILKQRHLSSWPIYREKLLGIHEKLHSDKPDFSSDDYMILEDIADAIDAECEKLFRRMSERR